MPNHFHDRLKAGRNDVRSIACVLQNGDFHGDQWWSKLGSPNRSFLAPYRAGLLSAFSCG